MSKKDIIQFVAAFSFLIFAMLSNPIIVNSGATGNMTGAFDMAKSSFGSIFSTIFETVGAVCSLTVLIYQLAKRLRPVHPTDPYRVD